MSDFESMPIGTAARLAELEAENKGLRFALSRQGKSTMPEMVSLRAEVERLRDSCAAKADRIDKLGETVGRLTADLKRAYRCIQGMQNALTNSQPFTAEGYHAPTIAAAKRFVWEDALDGAEYFTGKPVAVLHEALALPESMQKEASDD